MTKAAHIIDMPIKDQRTQDDEVLELERLILAYQLSDHRDKRIIWDVLDRYMPEVDGLLAKQR